MARTGLRVRCAAVMLTLLSLQVQAGPREEEAWRLQVFSRGLAERSGATLTLTLEQGRKRVLQASCSAESCGAWIWLGLDSTQRFHRLWRRTPDGRERWAWVARRTGRMTQMGSEPLGPVDDSWLAWVEPNSGVELRLASAIHGRLREIRLAGSERLRDIEGLRWWPQEDRWIAQAKGSAGEPLWVNLVRAGPAGWKLKVHPFIPPPASH